MFGSHVVVCLVSAAQPRSAFPCLPATALPLARSVLHCSATSWAHSTPTVLGLLLRRDRAHIHLIHCCDDPDTSSLPFFVGQTVVSTPCTPCMVWV
ncbi:hypothetical protein DFH06DRAFT_1166958 [Mycena polygramma]|nr:hypothetical protein DFH06DRAFT_1166958 [Mycena polygramma]